MSAAERLRSRRQELDEQDRRMLERMGAAALAAAGRRSEALEAYATLAKQFPRDGDLQEAHAQLLLAGEGRQTLEDALRQWRRVAQGSRVGSERWYRAKYSVALAQFKLGDKAEAAQLVRYVQAVAGLDNDQGKGQIPRTAGTLPTPMTTPRASTPRCRSGLADRAATRG